MMNAVLLARLQFALTVGFHFIFPPLTIGTSWLIFVLMTRYYRTGDLLYRTIARFWTKLFGITFAVGVATGITMEFQFGTNWSEYSRFVGDIFGAPLAAEALMAFFLESTFVGVLLFGWEKLSVKILWLASLMVAIGSTLSAFWIIVANSWMQTPAGYTLVKGRAELTSFFAAVFNPSTIPRFMHTVDAALITGAFFMMGVSAWQMLKKSQPELARISLRLSLIVALATSLLELFFGHHSAVQVAYTQPEKLATMEAIFTTQHHAPLLLFGIPDVADETVHGAIRFPSLLSILAFGDADTKVEGLHDMPVDQRPPFALTFYPFHLMVILGFYFIGLTSLGVLLLGLDKLFVATNYLRLIVLSAPLPILANQLGWITAEVGRQPWIVYRVLKTADAISFTVPPAQVLLSLILFIFIYAFLGAAWLFSLHRVIVHGPTESSH